MIDLELTEDHKALVQNVQEFRQKEVAPLIKEWDEKSVFRARPSSGNGRTRADGSLHSRTIRRRGI